MSSQLTQDASSRDRFWMRVIAGISVVLVAAIAALTMGPRPEGLVGTVDVSWMPHLNGATNTGTALSLLVALLFIACAPSEEALDDSPLKVYAMLGFHSNFYHSWRGDTPDEAGFGTDIRVVREILRILDVANAVPSFART